MTVSWQLILEQCMLSVQAFGINSQYDAAPFGGETSWKDISTPPSGDCGLSDFPLLQILRLGVLWKLLVEHRPHVRCSGHSPLLCRCNQMEGAARLGDQAAAPPG